MLRWSEIRPSRRGQLVVLGCLAVALILDFLFYSGFYASDDISYADGARMIAEGWGTPHFRPGASLAYSRLAINLPSAAVYWLSGGSVSAIAWFHVVYHLALVVVAFLLGRLYRDEPTGLIAAGLAAINPLLYGFAGAILPDNATALWLALLLLLLETARRRARDAPLSLRSALRWYVTAGLLLGAAYSTKETAVIMTVPCAAIIISGAPSLRDPVWIRNGAFLALGLAAFMLVESLGLRVLTGEWMFRLTTMQGAGDIFLDRMARQGTTPFERIDYVVHRRLLVWMPLTLWLLAAGAAAYPTLCERNVALLGFFWWPLLYLTIGTTSFSQYKPPSLQARYYAIVVIPAIVMTSCAVMWIWDRWRSSRRRLFSTSAKWAASSLLAMLVWIGANELHNNAGRSGNIYRSELARSARLAYEQARAWHPDYPIVFSGEHADRMAPLFFPKAPEDVTIHRMLTPGPLPEPPFLLLGPAGELPVQGRGDLSYPNLNNVHVRTLEIVYPGRHRIDEVAHRVRDLVGASISMRVPSYRAGTGIQLITRATGSEPPTDARVPLVPLRSDARVVDTDEGFVVSWIRERTVRLQLFDGRHYKAPPKSPSAQLDVATHRLRVVVDVSTIRGDVAAVTLVGVGYTSAGDFVRQQSARTPVSRAATRIAVDLRSDIPMISYRVGFTVETREGVGSIHISDARLDAAPQVLD